MKIVLNNKSYEIPNYTMPIAEKLELIRKAEKEYSNDIISLPDFLKIEFDFVLEILGDENGLEVLATNDLNSVDLHKVSIVTLEIINAYKKPIDDKKSELALNELKAQMNRPEVVKLLKLSEDIKK